MARIRNIKPEFYRHDKLQELGAIPMLVFSGLWTQCDSQGVFRCRPSQLKLDILPFMDFNMAQVIQDLADAGFLVLYSVDGESYGRVLKFSEHQRLSGKEASEGKRYPVIGNIEDEPGKQEGSTWEAHGKQEGFQERGNDLGVMEVGERKGVGKPLSPKVEVSQTTTAATSRIANRVKLSWNKYPRVEGQPEWGDPGEWLADFTNRLLAAHEPLKSEEYRVFHAEQMLATFDAHCETMKPKALDSPKKALENWLTTQRIKVAEIVERAAERKPSSGNGVANYTDEEWAEKMRNAQ